MRPLTLAILAILGTLTVGAGCTKDEAELLVRARTDYVPGIEFVATRVEVRALAGDEIGGVLDIVETVAETSDDFEEGVRIAELAGLTPGTYLLRTELLGPGGALQAERLVRVVVDTGTLAITVVVTRDCESVVCPGVGDDPTFLACLGGRCVDPTCTEETPEACPVPECTGDSECGAPAVACARARCVSGVCLDFGNDSACAADEYCDPTVGCMPDPTTPPMDSGVMDSAPPIDTSPPPDTSADADAGACTVHLGAGREHFCALVSGGAVTCWGEGDLGQLGDGSMVNRPTPVPVTLAGPAVDVNGGRYNTCAALLDGSVQCWGEGDSGQLGDSLRTSSPTPVRVDTISGIVEVALGAVHACAREAGGQAHCWGSGTQGRLGNLSSAIENSPVMVTNMSDAIRLGMSGGSTTCAIRRDGTLWCWGENSDGSVGDGTEVDALEPTAVSSTETFVDVDSRNSTTCGIDALSRVWCWGLNGDGQVGTGDTVSPQLVPVQVQMEGGGDLDGAVEVANGIYHTCALDDVGEVWCWGRNFNGQLGRDTGGADAPSAGQVPGLPAMSHVDASAFSTCGVDLDGGVWCWGEGANGQLGDGASTSRATPALAFDACP